MPIIEIQGEVVNCWRCGVSFVVPCHLVKSARRYGRFIRCPNGHRNAYPADGPTEEQKELRRLKLLLTHAREQAEARSAQPA